MGYDINFTGEILIDPPIPANETTGSGFPEPGTYGAKDIALRIVEEPVDSVPGAYRRVAVAAVPCMSSYTAYQITHHLQEIVNRWGDWRTFAGRIGCVDPQTGDLWRLEIHGDQVVEVRPRIVWPDGSEGAVR